MDRTNLTLLSVGTFCLALTVELALAQSGPIPSGRDPAGPAQTTQLNETSFPQLIQSLGFTVQAMKTTQGVVFWKVTVQQADLRYAVDVVPNRSKGQIVGFWLICDLGDKLGNPNALSAPALLKLLEKNHQIAPYFFSFNPPSGQIALNYEYPGNQISRNELQKQFSGFLGMVRSTHSLWDTKILQGGASLPPSPGASLVGTKWMGTETLQGYGKITFEFDVSDKATMIDTAGLSQGTWSQTGNQVTIKFFSGKVTYQGTITGTSLFGTASNIAGASWTFSVSLQSGPPSRLAPSRD